MTPSSQPVAVSKGPFRGCIGCTSNHFPRADLSPEVTTSYGRIEPEGISVLQFIFFSKDDQDAHWSPR